MSADERCDLCDLPYSQCVHGLEERQRREAARAESKKNRQRKLPRWKCKKCGKRRRAGRYSLCAPCLLIDGGRRCKKCGRLYRPKKSNSGTCGTCHGGDAFTITTMGSPTWARDGESRLSEPTA